MNEQFVILLLLFIFYFVFRYGRSQYRAIRNRRQEILDRLSQSEKKDRKS